MAEESRTLYVAYDGYRSYWCSQRTSFESSEDDIAEVELITRYRSYSKLGRLHCVETAVSQANDMAISPPRAGAAGPGGDPSKATHDKQVRIESEVRATAVYGHAVWLAHNDGTITIRKVRTTETVATIAASPQRGRPWALLSVEVPGARPAMWIGYSTGDILVLDIETRHEIKLVCRHTGGVYCLSEFGGMVFSGSNDFEIVQWRARDVSFVRQLNGHTNYVRALHAEGKVLISASDDHTVRVWNATNGQLISIGRFHRCGVGAMCRVGDSMWTGDDEGNIVAWRLQTLEQQELLKEHTARITSLKKIGSRVYSGSADHTIGVWEANSRTLVARIDEHRGWVTNVFSPAHLTRYYVWTAAADQTIRCWHHDEYRSCTKDVERFDDLQWYQIEYNPYRELNDELSTQVSRLETQCAHLLEAYSTDHSHIENCTTQVNIMRGTTAAGGGGGGAVSAGGARGPSAHRGTRRNQRAEGKGARATDGSDQGKPLRERGPPLRQ
jgi:WD40 repeat protein